MATAQDVLLQQFQMGQMLIEQFIADLSEKEFFQIPSEGANHPAWILGHIATSEDSMANDILGKPKRLPESIHELFKKGTTSQADASKYPTRNELVDMFKNSRANAMEALTAFDDSKWNDPSPEGWSDEFFPTNGSIWAVMGTHQFWHIGQLTVCRAALKKKPVM